MSTPETTPKTKPEDREEIFIPRGNANDDPNMYVSINGVNYLLPRGKTSSVPKHVANEIRRSWKAEETAANNARKREDAAK